MLVLTVTSCQPSSQCNIFPTNRYFIFSQWENILPTFSPSVAFAISTDFAQVEKGTSLWGTTATLRADP